MRNRFLWCLNTTSLFDRVVVAQQRQWHWRREKRVQSPPPSRLLASSMAKKVFQSNVSHICLFNRLTFVPLCLWTFSLSQEVPLVPLVHADPGLTHWSQPKHWGYFWNHWREQEFVIKDSGTLYSLGYSECRIVKGLLQNRGLAWNYEREVEFACKKVPISQHELFRRTFSRLSINVTLIYCAFHNRNIGTDCGNQCFFSSANQVSRPL
jgi:hypothetical protein